MWLLIIFIIIVVTITTIISMFIFQENNTKEGVIFSPSSKTRGNSRKLDKSQILTVRDGHSFAKRIVNTWNSLPDVHCSK